MTTDVTTELRAAMRDATADISPTPDLLRQLPSPRRTHPRVRLAVSLTAVAAAVTATVVVPLGLGGHGGMESDVTVASSAVPNAPWIRDVTNRNAVAPFGHWGRTRGNLAHDTSLRAQIRQQWAHPIGRNSGVSGFDPVVGADRPVQILWLGSTPDGPAAFVVQHVSRGKNYGLRKGYEYGVFVTTASGKLRLFQRMGYLPDDDLGDQDPAVFSIAPGSAADAVVVIPTDPAATVRVSFSHQLDSTGRVQRTWQNVAVADGAAVAHLPKNGNISDTVVQVDSHGNTVWRPVDSIVAGKAPYGAATANGRAGLPSNIVGVWCNGCDVDGSGDPAYGLSTLKAFAALFGPTWQPVELGGWSIGGKLKNGDAFVAQEMWLPGDPAHTVVVEQKPEASRVIADAVEVRSQRPLVALRLPYASGWLVGAGPDTDSAPNNLDDTRPAAVVTGWRASAQDRWNPVARRKALVINSNAASIQVRIQDSSGTTISTLRS